MSDNFSYPVNLSKEKKSGYSLQFVDFPEAITQGETIEEALEEAIDCLEEAIANRIALKLDVPAPSRLEAKQYVVTISAIFTAKLALYSTMKQQKLTNIQLAKKLNCDEKEVRRLLDLHYHSKLPRIEQALHCLGKRLRVDVVSF